MEEDTSLAAELSVSADAGRDLLAASSSDEVVQGEAMLKMNHLLPLPPSPSRSLIYSVIYCLAWTLCSEAVLLCLGSTSPLLH